MFLESLKPNILTSMELIICRHVTWLSVFFMKEWPNLELGHLATKRKPLAAVEIERD
jgi:hypothetical protein